MKSGRKEQKGNWWLAVAVACPLVVAVVVLLSIRRATVDTSRSLGQSASLGESQVGLTRLVHESDGNLVAAEAHFLDPTPLFLPTEWNAGQNVLPANVLRDPGQMFQDYPSRLAFTEAGLRLRFPDRTQVPFKSEDTISVIDDRGKFQGMGRGDAELTKLAPRGAYLEVCLSGSGERVLEEVVPEMAVPDGNWRPLKLVGVVDAAGLVGRLAIVQSSGVVEIDAIYRDYLEKTLLIGARLAPGFYHISVGP